MCRVPDSSDSRGILVEVDKDKLRCGVASFLGKVHLVLDKTVESVTLTTSPIPFGILESETVQTSSLRHNYAIFMSWALLKIVHFPYKTAPTADLAQSSQEHSIYQLCRRRGAGLYCLQQWSTGRRRRAQLGKVSPTDAYFALCLLRIDRYDILLCHQLPPAQSIVPASRALAVSQRPRRHPLRVLCGRCGGPGKRPGCSAYLRPLTKCPCHGAPAREKVGESGRSLVGVRSEQVSSMCQGGLKSWPVEHDGPPILHY